MKLKKVLALAMAAVLSMGALSACGDSADTDANANANNDANVEAPAADSNDDAAADNSADASTEVEAVSLKVWCPEEEMEITQQMADAFQAAHPEYDITWEIAVVGVDESGANLTTDPDSAADVFQMPSGSVAELVEAGLLLPIGYDIENVKSLYGEGAVAACMKDDMMYGIPSTPNSWFMYYNTSLFTEDEVKSLETMMAKDLGADVQNFSCTISNSWYIEAFFYAAGAQLYGPDGTDPTVCTWNGENGLAAGNYLIDLVNNPKYVEDKDGIAGALFKEGKLGALCSGTWSAPDLKEALGENYGACALPTININGVDSNLSNFADYKCFSVKSSTAHPLAAQQFAEWLGNPDNQLTRYQECGATPTALSLLDNPALAEDAATVALIAQTQYATPQPVISQISQYWTPAQALGEGIVNGEITAANLQEKLDQAATAITTPPVAE
uniref:extracellular solute-binding protein n=1 Tax=Acetatifactor sp. TaxID=1872090 RepID=UPI0040563868